MEPPPKSEGPPGCEYGPTSPWVFPCDLSAARASTPRRVRPLLPHASANRTTATASTIHQNTGPPEQCGAEGLVRVRDIVRTSGGRCLGSVVLDHDRARPVLGPPRRRQDSSTGRISTTGW